MQPILEHILENRKDGIIWQVELWQREIFGKDFTKDDPINKGKLTSKVVELLRKVENEIVRLDYVDIISKSIKVKGKLIIDKLDALYKDASENPTLKSKLPAWADSNEAMEHGFVEHVDRENTGYWFLTPGNDLVKMTNFILEPLYHLYSPTDNRRMMVIKNGYADKVIEMSSKVLLSPDLFSSAMYDAGTYLPQPSFTKVHLLKILNKISRHFPIAYELKRMGFQPQEGIFAFANCVYLPPKHVGDDKSGLFDYDQYGMVKVDEKNFLSPSNSKAMEDVRGEENIYENDIYLSYKKSSINFAGWSALMEDVYLDNAKWATAFVIATCIRDIINPVTKIPHLYAYGGVGSGKSEYGDSINFLFFSGKNQQGDMYKPLNLNQGTESAFFERMGRFRSCPNVLNEFDENNIDEAKFRAIKSAYDGEGRELRQKEKNKSHTQKIESTTVLMGQYLGSKDDNAVLTRSIPLAFRPVENRPQKQVDALTKLKGYQSEGLSSILIELMALRPFFKRDFADQFNIISKQMTEDLRAANVQAPTRILKNICCMISVVGIAGKHLKLPFTEQEFYNYGKEFIATMTNLVTSSSGISEFWSTLEYLLDRGEISEGMDFRIEEVGSVTIERDGSAMSTGENKSSKISFTPAKKILFLRLGNVHKLYQERQRKGTGKNALNEQTLLLYMKDQGYYVGRLKSYRFNKMVSSCYAFDLEKLGINLERNAGSDQPKTVRVVAMVVDKPNVTSIPGKYQFFIREQVEKDGKTVDVGYKCFTDSPFAPTEIFAGMRIQVLGKLNQVQIGDKMLFNIDVDDYEVKQGADVFTKDLSGMSIKGQEEVPELF